MQEKDVRYEAKRRNLVLSKISNRESAYDQGHRWRVRSSGTPRTMFGINMVSPTLDGIYNLFKNETIQIPLKRNRRVRSIIAMISPTYAPTLIFSDGETTSKPRIVTEQTLFRVMGLCSKPAKYEISHRYNAGTNPHLLHDGATFNLIITRKERDSAK